jgi:hypothetical protein
VSVTTLGTLAMATVCAFGSAEVQIGMLGALVSILIGLITGFLEKEHERYRRQTELLQQLTVPVALAADSGLFEIYLGIRNTLNQLAMHPDPILQEIARLKATSMRQEIDSLADGTIVFTGTEAWRTVYEKLLSSPDVMEYQSVAWVRSADYWQDAPGRRSLQVNFDAVRRGVLIERLVILPDELWPADEVIPTGTIGQWIESQHNFGYWVCLVRESQLAQEPDLVADFGIYGNRALGIQELDQQSRTVRFILQFDAERIRLARERWKRLEIFATPYRHLLDQLPDEW